MENKKGQAITAEETLRKSLIKYIESGKTSEEDRVPSIIEAMEQYAAQFKYDYSKNCECGSSRIGETWCCNQCGLPTTKEAQQTSHLTDEVARLRKEYDELLKDANMPLISKYNQLKSVADKMKDALESDKQILEQTLSYRNGNNISMGNIFLVSAIEQNNKSLEEYETFKKNKLK